MAVLGLSPISPIINLDVLYYIHFYSFSHHMSYLQHLYVYYNIALGNLRYIFNICVCKWMKGTRFNVNKITNLFLTKNSMRADYFYVLLVIVIWYKCCILHVSQHILYGGIASCPPKFHSPLHSGHMTAQLAHFPASLAVQSNHVLNSQQQNGKEMLFT